MEHARQLERKRRPHIWNNSFAKVKLFRELGGKLKIELNEDFKKVYTLGLQRRCMLELESGGEMAAFAVHASDDQREMTIAIGTITGSVRFASSYSSCDQVLINWPQKNSSTGS